MSARRFADIIVTGVRPSAVVKLHAQEVLQNIKSDYVAVHMRLKDSCHRPLPIGAPKKPFWECFEVHGVPEKDMVMCIAVASYSQRAVWQERAVWESIKSLAAKYKTKDVFIATHPRAWANLELPLFQTYFGTENGTLNLHLTKVNVNTKRWASEVDKRLCVAATAFMYSANCCSRNGHELPPGLSTWAGMTVLQRAANAEPMQGDPNVHSMEVLMLEATSCEANFKHALGACPHPLTLRPQADSGLACQKLCCMAGNQCKNWQFNTIT